MSSLLVRSGVVGGAALVAVLTVVAIGSSDRREAVPAAPVPAAEEAANGVRALLCAAPFELAVPYVHDWSTERGLVSRGWLVVLEVDPELVQPRQTAEPVLQMGTATLERVNAGASSGRLIAIVPVASDLAEAPAFFGAPELPERMDAAARELQLEQARMRGIEPFSAAEVAAALECGGGAFELHDRRALLGLAAQWILDHSPEEADKAHRLLRVAAPR